MTTPTTYTQNFNMGEFIVKLELTTLKLKIAIDKYLIKCQNNIIASSFVKKYFK